jgi:hypothetical protein
MEPSVRHTKPRAKPTGGYWARRRWALRIERRCLSRIAWAILRGVQRASLEESR